MKKLVLIRIVALMLLFCMAFGLTACDNLPKGTVNFTFMSFNARYENTVDTEDRAWDNRKDAFLANVLSYSADVICFQEVMRTQNEDLKSGLSEKYEIVYYARTPKQKEEGLAIAFDKEKFDLVRQKVFWFSATPNDWGADDKWGATQDRIGVNVLLKHKKSGLKINVFNVHLDNKSEQSRTKSVKMILDKVQAEEYPAFVMGDFNFRVGSSAYKNIAKELIDCQKKAKITDSGCTYQGFGDSENNPTNTAIDFCFITEKYLTPKTFKICRDKWGENNDKYLSDHYAIRMDIRYEK